MSNNDHHWIVVRSSLVAAIAAKDEKDEKDDSPILVRAARLFPDFTICGEDEPDLAVFAKAVNQWVIDPAPVEFYRRLVLLRAPDTVDHADALYLECARQIADAEGNPGNQEWWRAVQTLVGPPEFSQYYAFVADVCSEATIDDCIDVCRRARLRATAAVFPVDDILQYAFSAANVIEAEGRLRHLTFSMSPWFSVLRFLRATKVLEAHESAPVALRWLADVCNVSPTVVMSALEYASGDVCQVFEDMYPGKLADNDDFHPSSPDALVLVLKLRLAKMGLPVATIPHTEDYVAQAMKRGRGALVKWITADDVFLGRRALVKLTSATCPCPTLRFLYYCIHWSKADPNKWEDRSAVLFSLRAALVGDTAHQAGNVRCLAQISARLVENLHLGFLVQCMVYRVVVLPAAGTVEFNQMIARSSVLFAQRKPHRIARTEWLGLLRGDDGAKSTMDMVRMETFFYAFGEHLRKLQMLAGWAFQIGGDEARTNVYEPICHWLLDPSFAAFSVRKHRETAQGMAVVLHNRVLSTPFYAGWAPTVERFTAKLPVAEDAIRRRGASAKRKRNDNENVVANNA